MVDLHRSACLSIRRIGLTLALIGLVGWMAAPVYSRIGPRSSSLRQRSLTVGDRIDCQRAIEGVYWRHRIWPKANPRPKPTLDQVMPDSAIRAKVADYLRKSQALEIYWQRPITGDQLQAEMERMARQTKHPEMLMQLWAALGNDPYVIGECLARQSLANRLTALKERATIGNRRDLKWTNGDSRGMQNVAPGALSALPDDSAVPDARYLHTAVWTGSEMIVWGGVGGGTFLSTGWRYDPATDAWTATATSDAPSPRNLHTAVWTGREMIVWGGDVNTGGRYDPMTDTWSPTSTTSAPSPRAFHREVWTGNEMIVWGGYDDAAGVSLNTGGRYNPATDMWTATSSKNAPEERAFHTAVWTGSEMIVWGGFDDQAVAVLNTGGRYDPATDSWTATDTTSAAHARYFHTAVWTGGEMLVWGGDSRDGNRNDGGRYDPAADSWTATDTTNAPSVRDSQTAVWTGSEMIVWGGTNSTEGATYNTGGRYDPATDSWLATSATSAALRKNDVRRLSWLSVLHAAERSSRHSLFNKGQLGTGSSVKR